MDFRALETYAVSTMSGDVSPRYAFRSDPPSLSDLAHHGISDLAAVMPEAVLDQPAVQLPSPPVGPRSPLIVSDPGLAQAVLADRGERFGRDRLMRRLMRRSWGEGLAGAEGEAWRRQRQAAQPALRKAAIREQVPAFRRAVHEVVQRIEPGEGIDCPQFTSRIIARILLKVLLGDAKGTDPDWLAGVLPDYLAAIARFGTRDLLPLPESWHDRLAGLGRDPSVAAVREAARGLTQECLARGEGEALISLLASAGPAEDNVRGLMPAAMETTSWGVAWVLFMLSRRPELQDAVRRDACARPTGEAPKRDDRVGQLVCETLRLFPPAPVVVRAALQPVELGQFPVAKGQTVAISFYAMHRHRNYWDDPDRFLPDRFDKTADLAAFHPFGMGPRACVAASFALIEMMTVVEEVCRLVELTSDGDVPGLALQVTSRAKGPMRAKVRLRHDPQE